ncbi:MAG: mycofactocin biosynthesis peptidyl-dipeptidase MftE [Nitrososphaerota archaeon]
MRLGALPWTRARAALARGALLPLGSLEQHGPHLPLETDTLLALEVSRRLAGRLRLALLPPLPYGRSEEHLGFPGTIALEGGLLRALLGSIASSLELSGAPCLIIVNGHGGNREEVEGFMATYRGRLRLKALHLQEWARRALERFARPGALSHADLTETSLYLALGRPLLSALPGDVPPPAQLEERARRGEALRWRAGELSATGVIGSVSGASRELGLKALEALVEELARHLSAWLAPARRARRGGRRAHHAHRRPAEDKP